MCVVSERIVCGCVSSSSAAAAAEWALFMHIALHRSHEVLNEIWSKMENGNKNNIDKEHEKKKKTLNRDVNDKAKCDQY